MRTMFTAGIRECWLPAPSKYTESTPYTSETVKEPENECPIHSENTKVNYRIINAESLEFGRASLKKKKGLVHESQNH